MNHPHIRFSIIEIENSSRERAISTRLSTRGQVRHETFLSELIQYKHVFLLPPLTLPFVEHAHPPQYPLCLFSSSSPDPRLGPIIHPGPDSSRVKRRLR